MAKAKAKKAKSNASKRAKKSVKSKVKRAKSKSSPKKKASAKSAVKSSPKAASKAAKSYKGPRIGDTVKSFSAPATGGQSFELTNLKGKNVVLYFYPKDDTPGCTLEGHDFTKLRGQFDANATVVFGISRDSMESHEKFKAKQCYSVDLISDQDEKICKLFDVIQKKNMYGNISMGIERSTFVIDRNGVLRGEWRKVSVPGHAEEVLNFVKNLN
jgi:thioredoxin-dependent peroxiredoxin